MGTILGGGSVRWAEKPIGSLRRTFRMDTWRAKKWAADDAHGPASAGRRGLLHGDGRLRAHVHAGLAVGAVVRIDDGLAIDQADALGGAGLDAIFATGALGGIHERGHVFLLDRNLVAAARAAS
jgi:hypothetical protein